MGKKKAPKVVIPQTPDPPFTFNIDNVSADSGQCALHLFDDIEVHFNEVEIEIRINRDTATGKVGYDLIFVKSKAMVRPPGVYEPEELLPFPVVNMETGMLLMAEPARTGGRQPFVLIDPESKLEKTYAAPYFLHYELSNRTRYLLDLRKFTGGKLKFKDPETKDEILVDITQRVDTLSGQPLYGDYENPERVFLSTLGNEEGYVVQDPVTGDIEILGLIGEPALGYRTHYDRDTNTTTIVNDRGALVTVLEGRQKMIGDSGTDGESEELGEITFDGWLKNGEEADGGSPTDWSFGELVQLEKETELETRPVSQETRPVSLEDDTAERSSQLPGDFKVITDPVTGVKRFVDKDGRPVGTPDYRLDMDPQSGTIRLVTQSGDPVDLGALAERDVSNILRQLPDGYHLSQDADGNQLELVLPSGHILQFDPQTNEPLPIDSQRRIFYPSEGGHVETLTGPRKGMPRPVLFGSEDTRLNPEEEMYFEALNLDEGKTILTEARLLSKDQAKALLSSLIRTMELEKDFIDAAIASKITEEKDYIEGFWKDKEIRQRMFIDDMLQRQTNAYDRVDLEPELLEKLDRENEYLMDMLSTKQAAENRLLSEAMARELGARKASILARSNKTCYRAVKRLLYKQLSLQLEAEILQIRQELCKRFETERQEILNAILID